MRTFIAIELSDHTRAELAKLTDNLRPALGKITWVKPERMHLTLKFLGEIDEKLVEPIAAELKDICREFKPVAYKVVSMGCFPNPRRPRVIWVGMDGDIRSISELQRRVDNALEPLGVPTEGRGFKPHITLGRVRGSVRSDLLEAEISAHSGRNFGEEVVREVVLMRSQLRPEGPIYTPLARALLGG